MNLVLTETEASQFCSALNSSSLLVACFFYFKVLVWKRVGVVERLFIYPLKSASIREVRIKVN